MIEQQLDGSFRLHKTSKKKKWNLLTRRQSNGLSFPRFTLRSRGLLELTSLSVIGVSATVLSAVPVSAFSRFASSTTVESCVRNNVCGTISWFIGEPRKHSPTLLTEQRHQTTSIMFAYEVKILLSLPISAAYLHPLVTSGGKSHCIGNSVSFPHMAELLE